MWKFVKNNKKFLISLFIVTVIALACNGILEKYHNTLMLVITTIYVAATINMSESNNESAKATREQVEESKRQFDDNQRISMMPYLQSERTDSFGYDHRLVLWLVHSGPTRNTIEINFKFMNVGIGTAKDIEYVWNAFEGSSRRNPLPIRALHSGGSQVLQIALDGPAAIYNNNPEASIDIFYKDLLENEYVQSIKLTFFYTLEKGYDLGDYTTSSPKLIREATHA